MAEQRTGLSREFIEQQHQRLQALRRQVLGGELGATERRRSYEELHGDEAAEFEDQAQDSEIEEVRQAQHDVDDQRVANIERALQKIADGTYGYSDLSGDPIPKARLEATPEAVLTVEEERAKERGR
jgi:DnaK suppressor protein